MLRAQLQDKISSPGIAAILPIAESRRVIVAKTDGKIEVYSREHSRFKLFQVYPNLLQNLHIDDLRIYNLYYADVLSTIFIQCKKVIVLLNSYNLHVYDRVVEKRGISKCWILHALVGTSATDSDSEVEPSPEPTDNSEQDDSSEGISTTFLLYSTDKQNRLKLLMWKERTYKAMVDIQLPHTNDYVTSANAQGHGIILTTNTGVYLWRYDIMTLVNIQKIVEHKYPKDMVSAIVELRAQCNIGIDEKVRPAGVQSNVDMSRSISSASRDSTLSKGTSIRHYWHGRARNTQTRYKDMRYCFTTHPASSPFVIDGLTESLFEVNISDGSEPFLVRYSHEQFFEWNSEFDKVEYLSSHILMLSNSKRVKFVDYSNGFTFLEKHIPEGIKDVQKILGTYLLIWTVNDEILLFHYQVDDGTASVDSASGIGYDDDGSTDQVSICGKFHDSNFYYLWRKVLFYRFFLSSPYSVELCASPDPQYSLDLAAMKLRDFTVLWCLKIFESLERCLDVVYSKQAFSRRMNHDVSTRSVTFNKHRTDKLEEIITDGVFSSLIEAWAPPQLVILNTLPPSISRLIDDLTGEEHNCIDNSNSGERNFEYRIQPQLVRRYIIPYLTDTRRNVNNLLKNNNSGIEWHYYTRSILQKLDFFLLDDHGSITIDDMSRLLDTVLFKMYMKYNPNMVGPFLRVENRCDETAVVDDLKSNNKSQELVDFYFQRSKHKEALEYLVNIINSTSHQADADKIKLLVKELVIAYLKNLTESYTDDTLYYTAWVLKNYGTTNDQKTEILKEIFLNDNHIMMTTGQLPVYNFIKRYDAPLSLSYLELIVSRGRTESGSLLIELVTRYLDNVNELKVRQKLKSVLALPIEYDTQKMIDVFDSVLNGDYRDETQQLAAEIRRFIKVMKTYPLYKSGAHKISIDILFNEICDYRKSSLYCDKVFRSNEEQGIELMQYLFSKVIEKYEETLQDIHYDANSVNHSTTLISMFLKDHGSHLGSLAILKLLPKSLPIQTIGSDLITIMKSTLTHKEEIGIKRSLLQAQLIDQSNKLDEELEHFTTIGDTKRCPVCEKNFSVLLSEEVVWYRVKEKDYVVHQNCSKTLENRLFPGGRVKSDEEQHPRTVKDAKESLMSSG